MALARDRTFFAVGYDRVPTFQDRGRAQRVQLEPERGQAVSRVRGLLTHLKIEFGLFILETFNFVNKGMQFELYRDIQCISFFVIGFSLVIFHIFYVHKVYYSISFFVFQFITDLFLITWWVILTGGVFSGFYFLYIVLIFFYGRIVGFKESLFSSFLICFVIFIVCSLSLRRSSMAWSTSDV